MKIGILRETKIPIDNRVPFSPEQCRFIEEKFPGTQVFIEPSGIRCFADNEYTDQGIKVKSDLSDCDILFGVKEVDPTRLIPDKTYLFFSHTIKKQNHNKKLLKAVLDKHIRLVDYETLTDSNGIRIIGFGRWAGIVGTYLGIKAMCIRHNENCLPNPQECRTLQEMIRIASTVSLPTIKIAITGDGRVAGGAVEMMNAFGIKRVSVEEYLNTHHFKTPVFTQLDPEKYNRHKQGKTFDLQYFFKKPGEYESTFGRFCPATDLLVMAAYWDPRAPLLFTPDQMKDKSCRIKVIADITCDLNGSVPSTIRTTKFQEPYYDFNPVTWNEETPFSNAKNTTVMAIDNLPNGLPVEASKDYGECILKNILPLLLLGDEGNVISRATIARDGKLTEKYNYLDCWVNQPD
jgi:saccharopine dehydrogenase (NAD+, L-lysine forming)